MSDEYCERYLTLLQNEFSEASLCPTRLVGIGLFATGDNRTVQCRACLALFDFRIENLVELHAQVSPYCPARFGVFVRRPVFDVRDLGVTIHRRLDHRVNIEAYSDRASETSRIPLNHDENSSAEDRKQRSSSEDLNVTVETERNEISSTGPDICEPVARNEDCNATAVLQHTTPMRITEDSGQEPGGTLNQIGDQTQMLDVSQNESDKQNKDFTPENNLTEQMGYKPKVKSPVKGNTASKILNVLCEKCKRADSCVLYLPCRHLLCCGKCAEKAKFCSECRRPIEAKVNLHRS